MQLVFMLIQLIWHDFLQAYRHKSDWITIWMFFILVVSLFPLAVTPDVKLLNTIAPGLIWVAALLALLLSFNQFLRSDYEDGSLNLLLLSPYPLPLLFLAKILAHWLISTLPLIMITPVLALSLHLSGTELLSLLATLLLGTPVLSLLGGVVMSLTVGLRNQSVLLALLFLPTSIPVLIFGTGAVIDMSMGLPARAAFALLGALLVLSLTLAPLAASAALRLGHE